jgi:hypothetical protein
LTEFALIRVLKLANGSREFGQRHRNPVKATIGQLPLPPLLERRRQ